MTAHSRIVLAAALVLSGCGSASAVRTSGGTTGHADGGTGTTSGAAGTSGGIGGTGTSATTGGTSGTGGTTGNPSSTDFPAQPIVVDASLPGNVGTLFAPAGAASGGPCLSEPTLDAMIPRNWTPLHFEWTPVGTENVFEVRLHADDQTRDLVAYTTQSLYDLDPTIWRNFASHSAGHDITVTLRGATLAGSALSSGPEVGASGVLHLAPVDAPGSVVYWTSSDGTAFEGFKIGDQGPVTVLDPGLAGPASSSGSPTSCVACHASSPDGALVVYTRDAADGTRAIDVRQALGGTSPTIGQVSPAALTLFAREKNTAPTLSAGHYSATDAVAISIFQDATLTSNLYELIWTDLHATDGNGWGVIPRTGDGRQAASPAWRHDGTAIAYVSAPSVGEGVVSSGTDADPDYDIYVVPYGNKQGGTAVPLQGASDPNWHEFYPVYSPGDTFVAFDRLPLETDGSHVNSYNQPNAEVCVVPSQGGTATRLRANDPPVCSGHASPGLTNSWPRWAPSATVVDGKKYYWLVFSSKRHPASNDGAGNLLPQLYVAAIVTDVSGPTETIVKDYPAVYVSSQTPSQSNRTPAWDVFQLE